MRAPRSGVPSTFAWLFSAFAVYPALEDEYIIELPSRWKRDRIYTFAAYPFRCY